MDKEKLEQETTSNRSRSSFMDLPIVWKIGISVAIIVPTALLLAVVFILIGFAASDSIQIGSTSAASSGNEETCTTASCVKLAASVLRYMDASVDPCEDFYNYSCGGWRATNDIPSDRGYWDPHEELYSLNALLIKKLVTGSLGHDSSINAIRQLRALYESCVDTSNLDMLGAAPLIELLKRTGGWELVNIQNASADAWSLDSPDFLASKLYENPAYFHFTITENAMNSSEYIAQLSQSGLTLPSFSIDAYLNEQLRQMAVPVLQQFIASILSLLAGPTGNPAELMAAATEIVNLEIELAKIFVSSDQLRLVENTYNLYYLSTDLANSTLFEQFDWVTFIRNTFESVDINIDENIPIVVTTPSFFENLTNVYYKFDERVHENYFKWNLVRNYVQYLGSDFVSIYNQLYSQLFGFGDTDRSETCVGLVQRYLPFSLARLYTDNILSEGAKGNVSEMINHTKTAFNARLDELEWLDQASRTRSQWKAGNITEFVAYPDFIFDETELDKETDPVSQENADFFKSITRFIVRAYRKNLRNFGMLVDKKRWPDHISPTYPDATYSAIYNAFFFLEGNLHEPFFDAGWPSYFKYGAFGVMMGHQMTNGFDERGRQYDENGFLTQNFWDQSSVEEFNKRSECFVEQYNRYSIHGSHIDGTFTLRNNVADNGGLNIAYRTYKAVSEAGRLPSLPGVNLTPDQLFFLAYGQITCSLFAPEHVAIRVLLDSASLRPYRLIGPVSNSEEFAAAFNCPAGSAMNPVDKCVVW